jgi:hypothetical protein
MSGDLPLSRCLAESADSAASIRVLNHRLPEVLSACVNGLN